MTVTHYIYHRDDKLISFVLDVQHRSGEGLLFLRRFCFNWDVRGGTLIPLSEVTRYHKKLMRENMLHSLNDYSLAPDTLFIQRSTFTREGGARCRRSQYKKFLTTVPYDLRALRGGTRDSGGKDDLKNDVFSGIML